MGNCDGKLISGDHWSRHIKEKHGVIAVGVLFVPCLGINCEICAKGKYIISSFGDLAFWDLAFWDLAFWDLAFWDLAFWDLAFWDLAFWDLAFWDLAFRDWSPLYFIIINSLLIGLGYKGTKPSYPCQVCGKLKRSDHHHNFNKAGPNTCKVCTNKGASKSVVVFGNTTLNQQYLK
jgi:hypothetical protein